VSFLKKLFKDPRKTEIEVLAYELKGITKSYPALSPFIDPLVNSLLAGKKPKGGKTDYKEVASLINGTVINIAKKYQFEPLIPKLKKLAQSIEQLADEKKDPGLNVATITKKLLHEKKFDEAINNLLDSLEEETDDKNDTLYNLGFAYYAKALNKQRELDKQQLIDLFNKAESLFDEVLSSDPNYEEASETRSALWAYKQVFKLDT
jgi:tetratricopeptide (TPR) repeat protein